MCLPETSVLAVTENRPRALSQKGLVGIGDDRDSDPRRTCLSLHVVAAWLVDSNATTSACQRPPAHQPKTDKLRNMGEARELGEGGELP